MGVLTFVFFLLTGSVVVTMPPVPMRECLVALATLPLLPMPGSVWCAPTDPREVMA